MSELNSPSSAAPVIVVGYFSSAEGRAALDRAISEAGLRGFRLVVLHTSADTASTDLEAELTSAGVAYEVRARTDAVDPAEELLTLAEETSAEFIVIGLRKRSPVGKLLLGSNAQRVLLDAGCPVLAVTAESR